MKHTYSGNGDRASTTDANNKTTRFEYDAYGNLEAVQAPTGARPETPRDGRGRVVASIDGNGNRTGYRYDEQDNLTKQTNAQGACVRARTTRSGTS